MTQDPDSPLPRPARPVPENALPRISALSLLGPEGVSGPNHLLDLLRSATRQCRKLVDCERVRLWVARRGGRRLVARDFPEEGTGQPHEHRLSRGEGLAGWAMDHQATLRLAAGDAPPQGLHGHRGEFRNALVIPLLRRGEPFGAIECVDKRGGDFTDADFDRLEVAADSVAFALDYALLYQEIERRALEKEVLLDITRALASPFDLEEVIDAIFKSLRQVVDYDAAAIYLVQRGSGVLEMVSEVGYPTGSEHAFELQLGQGIVGWVGKTGQSVIVPDVGADKRYVAARAETRSEIATPLMLEGRVFGVFNLESDLIDAYHEGHLELLSAFAAQAAVAVERARTARDLVERRRLEKELAIAREIQRSFLPAGAPVIPGFDLAGTSITHDEVGGDYFDFIPVSPTRLGLAVADVSGKGIPAALLMAGFRMSLLAEIRNEFAIRAVMRKANGLLHESTERDKFVTAFYGVLDWRNSILIFSNAGHNPPLVMHRDGTTEHLLDGGVALGVLPDSSYEERPIALREGDLLVFYTDGVSEAENEMGEQFGEERLEQVARANADLPAEEILRVIVASVVSWTGEKGPSDDLTLIIVRKTGPTP
ncbi:MAG: SpoIIE family protein phosphatase [Candidatus Eisenbacteria bacterium]|nr:SpoIIE family protein phosphatase [Candidatus Eisenbacteria bacterium]